jgi:hypothetical protein
LKFETREPVPRKPRGRRAKLLLAGLAAAAFAVWSAALFGIGVSYYKLLAPELLVITGSNTIPGIARAFARAPAAWLRARFSGVPVEHLDIDIKFKHLHKLHEKRAEALRLGTLLKDEGDFVPATIRHAGREVRVKLRLKGDQTDHLDSDKWSMRVHVRGGDQLFGMRRFSLQHPKTRGYQLEILFLQHLRDEGVLAPRYRFVDVSMNGKSVGLMALEEHFAKELIESQHRRESVIVRFDEGRFWDMVAEQRNGGPFDSFETADVRSFDEDSFAEEPKLAAAYDVARGLLQGFVRGELAARDVFDVDLLARVLASAEIWRSYHATRWHNLRFYLNPLTLRLEPVAFDGNLHIPYAFLGLVNKAEAFSRRLLEDDVVRAAFLRELRRMARDMADGTIPHRMQALEAHELALVHRETPTWAPLDYTFLQANAAMLARIDEASLEFLVPSLGAPQIELPTAVVAYLDGSDGDRSIELANPLPVPVDVTELRFASLPDGKGALPVLLEGATLPIELPPTPVQGRPTRLRVAYRLPDPAAAGAPVEGVARARGQAKAYAFRAEHRPPTLTRRPLPEATREEVLARHPFLAWDAGSGFFTATPGAYRVRGSLVLPAGAGLRLPAGTTLRFEAGQGILLSGPTEFLGTAEAPVVLEPAGEEPFTGLNLIRSERPSKWAHVHVRGTIEAKLPGWNITGAITIYENPITFEHCRFTDNQAEDAINLFRSRFTMKEIEVARTRSDAFDGDFVTGRVEGGYFHDIGGDAIDVSGSDVDVVGARVADVRDKGLSIGEASVMRARDVHIARAGTGVAAKDRSDGKVEDATLEGIVHVGLMAYMKKPEYGGSRLEVSRLSAEGVSPLALAQTGSRLVLEGTEIPPEPLDVDALYEHGYMKK